MEFEVSYSLDSEQQFWDELEDIVSRQGSTHELIDNALRAYLHFTTNFKAVARYLNSEPAITRCSSKLLESALFQHNKDYVRRQLAYGLLQEDDAPSLHLIASFLLLDGRNSEEALGMMKAEGVFPRLVELVQSKQAEDSDAKYLLLNLMYEISRIQRLTWEDMSSIGDRFVLHLLQIVETVSDDINDPYHYTVIRVLLTEGKLVLNEQYLVSSTSATQESSTASQPLTNRVMKIISNFGHIYKTFGENIILLLNRETETSCQFLFLKLLYLLFSSSATAEYFYTNDLHVLVDVILRNLLDLPSDSAPASALRHTYLRVLHPLLVNSQLAHPPHYKRTEINRLLGFLMDAGVGNHFAPADPTTVRLVQRCLAVPWLRAGQDEEGGSVDIGAGRKELAKRMLGMSVSQAHESSLSVAEVAAHTEKPGVQTPSKSRDGGVTRSGLSNGTSC